MDIIDTWANLRQDVPPDSYNFAFVEVRQRGLHNQFRGAKGKCITVLSLLNPRFERIVEKLSSMVPRRLRRKR